jgi:hypothetical protein
MGLGMSWRDARHQHHQRYRLLSHKIKNYQNTFPLSGVHLGNQNIFDKMPSITMAMR